MSLSIAASTARNLCQMTRLSKIIPYSGLTTKLRPVRTTRWASSLASEPLSSNPRALPIRIPTTADLESVDIDSAELLKPEEATVNITTQAAEVSSSLPIVSFKKSHLTYFIIVCLFYLTRN
jgi:hypothetical protein